MNHKIFWLDDEPNFPSIIDIEELSKGRMSRKKLLENTVFAYDYSSAEEILKNNSDNFSLYIIDGDFPLNMRETQKIITKDYIENLKKGRDISGDLRTSIDFENHYPSAFVEFVIDNVLPKKRNFVIHSMSREAEKLSCLLGWPFYAKVSLKGISPPKKRKKEIFYHTEVTKCVPNRIFDKVYRFIQDSEKWKPVESTPNFFQSKEISDLKKDWKHGDYKDLVNQRIIPLFE